MDATAEGKLRDSRSFVSKEKWGGEVEVVRGVGCEKRAERWVGGGGGFVRGRRAIVVILARGGEERGGR